MKIDENLPVIKENIKRVCEKCGFTYTYTKENIYVSLIDAYKTEHISCLTKEDWKKR